MNSKQTAFVGALVEKFGSDVITRSQIDGFAAEYGIPSPIWLYKNSELRVGRGKYQMDAVITPIASAAKAPAPAPVTQAPKSLSVETTGFDANLVPEKDPLFVPFGSFKDLKQVTKSKMFYPMYITGLSGNGKTKSVIEACAATGREIIRVNLTVETDEDDLIGGFRLVDGETRFFHGPVIKAMKRGAVLLLDEVDLANPTKITCLQSILEGDGYHIKKTGEFIEPAEGFNIIATANTKGKGSEDGRFIGTNVMNEAFLERFPVTLEQEYPTPAIEKKLLTKQFDDLSIDDPEFVDKLVDWADIIRKTFMDGGVDEIISTRRLVHIAKAHAIWNDRMTSIEKCINRFDDDTKLSFMDLYTKVDAGVNVEGESESSESVDIPF